MLKGQGKEEVQSTGDQYLKPNPIKDVGPAVKVPDVTKKGSK